VYVIEDVPGVAEIFATLVIDTVGTGTLVTSRPADVAVSIADVELTSTLKK
jgi:hypothetical protein